MKAASAAALLPLVPALEALGRAHVDTITELLWEQLGGLDQV